jgi:hypothetical protein
MSTVANSDRSEPDSLDLLQTLRMVKPKIFKSKNIGLGDVGANLDSTWQVIRRDPSKRKDHRKGENTSPSNRGKEPVNLFKKGDILHITPSITLPFIGNSMRPK